MYEGIITCQVHYNPLGSFSGALHCSSRY